MPELPDDHPLAAYADAELDCAADVPAEVTDRLVAWYEEHDPDVLAGQPIEDGTELE